MVVAIFSALQSEIDLIVDSLERPAPTSIARWPVWSGQIGKIEVVIARAGLGKVNTAALAAILWERHRPSLMLFTGVAGGLDPDLGLGDIVIGERTIQHDAGVIGSGGSLERYQAGHIPFYNPTDQFGFEPSPALLEAMRSVAPFVELSLVLDRQPGGSAPSSPVTNSSTTKAPVSGSSPRRRRRRSKWREQHLVRLPRRWVSTT